MVTMSFPGLGIQEFSVDPVLFSFGKIEVRWYGLIITCGIILAFLYATYRAKHEGIIFDYVGLDGKVILPTPASRASLNSS